MYFCEEDIMCISVKSIYLVYLKGGYVYFCEKDIVCISEKRNSVSISEDDILCIPEKRTWFAYLRREYSVFI